MKKLALISGFGAVPMVAADIGYGCGPWMMGGFGSGFWIFGVVLWILVLVALVLLIAWLIKQLKGGKK